MLATEIQQTLFNQIASDEHPNAWQMTDTVINARECCIYQAQDDRTGQRIAIKQYRNPRPTLAQYFQQMASLAEKMQRDTPKFQIAHPLAYQTENNILCMEWLDAEMVDYRLWRYFYHRQHQQNTMRLSMQWLRNYHHQANWQELPLDSQHYTQHINEVMHDGNDATIKLQQDAVFLAGYECLQKYQNEFDELSTPHALLHGDFTPSNVMINPQATYGIDIDHTALLPVWNDLASMLTYIAVGYPNMLTRGDMKQRLPHWPLPTILLKAYVADHTQWPTPHYFSYVFLYQILKRWWVVSRRCEEHKSWLDRWRLYKFRQICQALCQELEQNDQLDWQQR